MILKDMKSILLKSDFKKQIKNDTKNLAKKICLFN